MVSAIFSSVMVRVLLAALTAFVVGVFIGPAVIENLKKRQIGQAIREEGVAEHKKKAGIPTMGGMIILIAALIGIILYAKWNPYVLITVLIILIAGFIGMMDDLTKVLKARSLGLTPRQKLAGQIVLGVAAALTLRYLPGLRFEAAAAGGALDFVPLAPTNILVPWYGVFDLGIFYLPFVAIVVVAATNAVNLTDGLDGLAAGTASIALVPFLLIALIAGTPVLARALTVIHIPGVEELAIVCAAMLGGCLGFLWYNGHPAEVFMGDMGSLALGGTFAALAVCTKTELFLVIIGGIFVIETLSVLTQVSYFKYTKGKRIFRMSPIHHHFELCGWAEQKVTVRFWMVGLVLGILGLATYLWKALP
jgi:phospho-N-acetylmuramoyl-pentapeptide-transferase